MLLKIADWVESTEGKRWDRIVVLSHFMFAFLIFSPFFLFGRYIVGSTDNFFHHFPNMLFSGEAFRAGELGLWNPYILGGIDFSASTHNFIYYPVNWLIFAFPEKYFFLLITLRMFIEVWLVGVFGYLFFKEELQDRKWAFFASSIYQLCGYMFFSITTYPNLTHYLLITITLYVIWTIEKRRACLSYVYLALCSIAIMLCGNIVYAFAAMLIIGILFVYRRWPRSLNPFCRQSFIFYAGCITGVLVSMVRLLPVAYEVMFEGSRAAGFSRLGGFSGYNYMGITAFIPEAMGINFGTSVPIIESISSAKGAHAQFHGYAYFGALPAILAFWAVIKIKDNRLVFWKIYLLIASLYLLRVQPFSNIVDLILAPFAHTIVPKMALPIAFCTVAGYAAMYTERRRVEAEKRDIGILGVIVGTVVCIAIMVWVMPRQDLLLKPLKFTIISLTILVLAGSFLYQHCKGLYCHVLFYATIAGVITVSFLFVRKFTTIYPEASLFGLMKTNRLFFSSVIYISTSILTIALLWLVLNRQKDYLRKKTELLPLSLAGLLMIGVIIYPFHGMTQEAASGVPILTVFGITRFILISLLFMTLIAAVKTGKIKPELMFVFFFFILLADLLPYNKMYAHQVMNPFFRGNTLYPSKDFILRPDVKEKKERENLVRDENVVGFEAAIPSPDEAIDIDNFRINHPHILLKIQGNEPATNIPSVYGVRSYGGANSSVLQQHLIFAGNFTSSFSQGGGGMTADMEDGRCLDLMGCRYDVDKKGNPVVRPNALSRFMVFRDFEVITDEQELLKKLKDAAFNPQQEVLLSADPGISRAAASGARVEYSSIKTSEIEVEVETGAPALLFFGDTYRKDWKAYVNGKEQPVIRANYDFMTTAVPAGRNKVVFLFEPSLFLCGLHVTYAGIAVFFVVAGVLYILRKRFGEMGNRSFKEDLLSHIGTFGTIYVILIVLVFVQVMRCEGAEPAPTAEEVEVYSNLFPDFLHTADSVNTGPFGAMGAFDGKADTFWETASSPFPHWLQIDFERRKRMIKRYALQTGSHGKDGRDSTGRMPKEWRFEGSNDGSNWTVLDTQADQTNWKVNEKRVYGVTKPDSFRYYRVYITAGIDANILRLYEVEMMK